MVAGCGCNRQAVDDPCRIGAAGIRELHFQVAIRHGDVEGIDDECALGRIHIDKLRGAIGLDHHVVVCKIIVAHCDGNGVVPLFKSGLERPCRRAVHDEVTPCIVCRVRCDPGDSRPAVLVQPNPPAVKPVASVTRGVPDASGDVPVPKSNLFVLGGGGGGVVPPLRAMIGFDHRARSPVADPLESTVRMNFTSLTRQGLRSTLAL